MKFNILTAFVIICLTFSRMQAQAQNPAAVLIDTLMNDLQIERRVADSLTRNLYNWSERYFNNITDTILTLQDRNKKRVQLSLEREEILKTWLTQQQYIQWRQVYKGRHDPVMLLRKTLLKKD